MTSDAMVDRRVQIVEGIDNGADAVRRVSDLRPHPFVVLLGEPGIGKSTVLRAEAELAGTRCATVREMITGGAVSGETLFVDALDEYRVDGQHLDKAYNLAAAISASGATRWRLSCRSEDWRSAADMAAIKQTTAGAPVVVAQLLPLERDEAEAVLYSLREPDPAAFLAKATSLGATAFARSPLSLKLLHKAVAANGEWPATRHELFEQATLGLAHEKNAQHQARRDRAAAEAIVQLAGELCLLLLTSGSRAIWRSSDEPPHHRGDARAYLLATALGRDHGAVRDTLDTALFRGEGESFEPMHRSVAEFLAGGALARIVGGGPIHGALPLARALALITGADGCPPTELRGLYAWFAAHLAMHGDHVGAERLIEADAPTVLVYGDAAAFRDRGRLAILENLDRRDPYFLAIEDGVLALGALASEDLIEAFTSILLGPSDGTHRYSMILEALSRGRPLPAIRPILREVALDPNRDEWKRRRAIDAWLNGAADPVADLRELLDELAREPVSTNREALRVHLAAALPPSALSTLDLKSVIADFYSAPGDNTVGRLAELARTLERQPRPELFQEPIGTWLPGPLHCPGTVDVESLLAQALAACIRAVPAPSAAVLVRWTDNAREHRWESLGQEVSEEIGAWLDVAPAREVELLDVLLLEDDPSTSAWAVLESYRRVTGRWLSATAVLHLLARADQAAPAQQRRLLEIAVAIARNLRGDDAADAYWSTYARLERLEGADALLRPLASSSIDRWRIQRQERAAKLRAGRADQRQRNVEELGPLLHQIRRGENPGVLGWAARNYLAALTREHGQVDVQRFLADLADEDTADAILAGWRNLTRAGLDPVDARTLGATDAETKRYIVEYAVIAGLIVLLEGSSHDPTTIPQVMAIVVLKSSSLVHDDTRRNQIERWAIDRLSIDRAEGASQLLEFWTGALDAGAQDLPAVGQFSRESAAYKVFGEAVRQLLSTRPALHPDALRSALRVAVKGLDASASARLAAAALESENLGQVQRTMWGFVAFALAPLGDFQRFIEEHGEAGVADLVASGLVDSFRGAEGAPRTHVDALVIRAAAPSCTPDESFWHANGLAEHVRRSLNALASLAEPTAGHVLAQLIEHPELARWHASVRHAQAQHARIRREATFKHPSPKAIRAALAAGPPANAADLQAVVVDVLERLQYELKTDDTTPWKRYWSLDSYGRPTAPLVEEECRDRLLERIRDRLVPHKITTALPEARRGQKTRADIVILSGAGNLPIECKRHHHPDLWTAASTQLNGYAASPGADGFGIYLVFWFGLDVAATPRRPNGAAAPASAAELHDFLIEHLPQPMRARTAVLVLDVSAQPRDAS